MSTPIGKDYYRYSNGAYELREVTEIPQDSKIAITDQVLRKITGPIPREEICRLVEHIDLDSPEWQEEMQAALSSEQFIVEGINSELPIGPVQEIGMTIPSYISSYFNLKTASLAAASALTFFAPSMIAKYYPDAATYFNLPLLENSCETPEYLDLPPTDEAYFELPPSNDKDMFTYSWDAWKSGFNFVNEKIQAKAAFVPDAIKAPLLGYLGYQGLQGLMDKAIQYPAADYKTWTALNLQAFLQKVYPKIIPVAYGNDPVLNEVKSAEGLLIRSPFKINKPEEFGKIYEEHVLKNILSNQERTLRKMYCLVDGTTEIQHTDIERDQKLSDRIELRLLLLDAHANKRG